MEKLLAFTLIFVMFLPTLCAAQTSYIDVTNEVSGTLSNLTWGVNLHTWRPDENVRIDGLPKSGITFSVVDMLLHTVFKDNEIPNFGNLDTWMSAVKSNNVVPDVIVGFMPTWLSRDGTNYAPPTNMTKYLELVEIAVNHVKDDVIYYEIWGEPNQGLYRWNGTIIEYRELLVSVSQKIKATDSDAVILAPVLSGIAPQFFDRDQTVQFIEEVCVNASDYIDIYSFHTYDWPPESWPGHMDNYKQLLDQYGCGDKPLMMTESSIWKTEIKWNYRDVLQKAKQIKVLLDHDVNAQVHFAFNTLYTTGAWWHGLYNATSLTFTPIGKYYQLTGKHNLKFYGDRLKINSNIQDNIGEISFIGVKNEDNDIIVQITNSFSTNKEVQVNFQGIRNLTVYESSSDQVFDYPNRLGYNSSLILTLKPYSVYLIGANYASLVEISGQLNDTTIQADITAYQSGTNNIINSTSTINGNYNFLLYPDLYDLKYSLTNFFIPNFFIKLNSINIESNSQDLVSNINNINSQNVSFIINTDDNPTVQIYSAKKPSRVFINRTAINESLSYSQLINNTWFYDSNNLYIKGGCACTGWIDQGCGSGCRSDEQKQTRHCTPSECAITSQCVYTSSCIAPAILFEDGFETGDFSSWTGTYGSPRVVSTNSYSGSYSCEINASGNYPNKIFDNQTTVFVRGYFKFSELPTSGNIRFLRLYYGITGGGYTITRLWLEWVGGVDGHLTLRLERFYPYTMSISTPIIMSANTWYPFEIKFVKHPTNGEYRVWFNGNEIISETGLDTSMSPDANRMYLTDYFSTTVPITVWTDSIIVSNSYVGT